MSIAIQHPGRVTGMTAMTAMTGLREALAPDAPTPSQSPTDLRRSVHSPSPAGVVQAQLTAYDAGDVDRLLQTHAVDARQFVLHGGQPAQGREAIRARLERRFMEPDLPARVLARIAAGSVVVDLELATRNFPEGLGTVEMLCVYEVVDGAIRNASFAAGAGVLAPGTTLAERAGSLDDAQHGSAAGGSRRRFETVRHRSISKPGAAILHVPETTESP